MRFSKFEIHQFMQKVIVSTVSIRRNAVIFTNFSNFRIPFKLSRDIFPLPLYFAHFVGERIRVAVRALSFASKHILTVVRASHKHTRSDENRNTCATKKRTALIFVAKHCTARNDVKILQLVYFVFNFTSPRSRFRPLTRKMSACAGSTCFPTASIA